MLDAIVLVANNIGMSFENVITLITCLGCLVFFAKDFKLGIMLLFIMNGGLFIWFYEAGYNFVPPLVIFFLALVIMALSLYAVNKLTDRGAFV